MNYQRAVSGVRFLLVIMCIALLLGMAIMGVYINDDLYFDGIFKPDTIRLGLDLAGGSVITYEAETDDTGADLVNGMDSILTVMRDRLDSQGFTEALVYLVGDKMVTIEIPGVDDPSKAAESFMQTAYLEFKYDGTTVFDGSKVTNAQPAYDTQSGSNEYIVTLTLNSEGASIFSDVTEKSASSKKSIDIVLDGVTISNPVAEEKISGGQAIIKGSFETWEDAKQLADNIRAGALAYSLERVEMRTVGATLGENSLNKALIAGAIGLALVLLFMMIYYRMSGVFASVALVCYTALFMLVLIFTQANLTLPGIAGIVLSIGMAVDSNVVIFERIKEEIAAGKSAKAAVKGGFKRAFSAILDANITTIIACAVLYFLGSGTIKGFAVTLFFGVIISLFTALVITRILLYTGIDMGLTNVNFYKSGFGDLKLFKKFHFIKNRKTTLIILAVVFVIGVGSFAIRGFNIDIDFSGGTEIQIDLGTEVTSDICTDINSIIANNEKLGQNYVSSTTRSSSSSTMAIIRTGTAQLTPEQEIALIGAVEAKYEGTDSSNIQITTIYPSIGNNLKKTAFLAVAIAVVAMLIYIWIRFQLKSGIAAIVALVHDLFIMLAVYSLLQIPINQNIIAALLTILGYSINATIIIFDRVRENKMKLDKNNEFSETVNTGVHETLGRSFNTTFTTLLTIGMIFIFGVESIRNFAFPLIIGILAGLFSSVFVSGMVWDALEKAFSSKGKKAKKAIKAKK